MGRAKAIEGSVTEMRRMLSVVLISSDLPTMTRNGAEPAACCDWGGSVVVGVPVGAGFWSCAAASCSRRSAHTGEARVTANSNALHRNTPTFIFGFSLP